MLRGGVLTLVAASTASCLERGRKAPRRRSGRRGTCKRDERAAPAHRRPTNVQKRTARDGPPRPGQSSVGRDPSACSSDRGGQRSRRRRRGAIIRPISASTAIRRSRRSYRGSADREPASPGVRSQQLVSVAAPPSCGSRKAEITVRQTDSLAATKEEEFDPHDADERTARSRRVSFSRTPPTPARTSSRGRFSPCNRGGHRPRAGAGRLAFAIAGASPRSRTGRRSGRAE